VSQIRQQYINKPINKQQIINNLDQNAYTKLYNDYSQNSLPAIIDKYCDIIFEISKNEIFTNKIFDNITNDSDDEYIKQKITNKIFFELFNGILKTNLEKLKLIGPPSNEKNNIDYDFFDKNYPIYMDSWSIFVNKIFIFKLQNQNELNNILKSHKTDNIESFEKNILNKIYELTNIIIDILDKK
jgi:uncharacterized membrane protein YheB (UPF0754 family)